MKSVVLILAALAEVVYGQGFGDGFSFGGGGFARIITRQNNIDTSNFYVAANGNDALSGHTTDSAWATIARVNARTFKANDKIHLRRGDTWKEALTVLQDSLTFDAYGSGANPLLDGADTLTVSWSAYAEQSLNDSLRAYYKLDEVGTGDRADATGRGNTLLDTLGLVDTVGILSRGIQSASSGMKSLHINDNADLSIGLNKDFTVTAWVYLNVATGSQYFVTKGLPGVEGIAYRLSNFSGTWYFEMGNGTSLLQHDANTAGIASTGQWYFLCAWYDATADSMYISVNNGSYDAYPDASGAYDDPGQFRIAGNVDAFPSGGEARIDEVGLWKRVLTAAERTALYNGGSGITHPFPTVANIWKAYLDRTYGGSPSHPAVIGVFLDGVRGTLTQSLNDVNTTGEWFWQNDTLYVYSTTDPTGRLVEVSEPARDYLIEINGKSYITVDGIDATRASTGIMVYDYSEAGGTNVTIKNNRLYDNYFAGLEFSVPNVTVQNVRADHNGIVAADDENAQYHQGIYAGSNSQNGNVYADNFLIENCQTDSNAFCGIQINSCGGGTVRYNTTFGNGTLNNSGHGIGIFSIRPGKTINAYYNIVHSNTYYAGISVHQISSNDTINVWNNTIYKNSISGYGAGLWGVRNDSTGAVLSWKNNLIFSGENADMDQSQDASQTVYQVSNNLYYKPTGLMITWDGSNYTQAQFATYQTASSDTTSLSADPLVTNAATFDFTLQAGSPAINAGTNLGLTRDYLGNPIVGNPDIGAYERQP